MTAKRPVALLWNANARTYQAIHEFDGEWFIAADLGIDYDRAKTYVKEHNTNV